MPRNRPRIEKDSARMYERQRRPVENLTVLTMVKKFLNESLVHHMDATSIPSAIIN